MNILLDLFSLVWPVAKKIPHQHSWRVLTSADDYGRFGSKHWGRYGGVDQEECTVCGECRYIEYGRNERRLAAERETAAEYNLSADGIEHWRKRSKKNDGPIMIGDGGTVSRLEFGTIFNGECQILSQGRDSKSMMPIMIFRRGELVTHDRLRGDAPANPLGQAHLDRAHDAMKNSGFEVYEPR